MSEILHGVLNMPPELWTGDDLSKMQRYNCYLEADRRIEDLERNLELATKALKSIKREQLKLTSDNGRITPSLYFSRKALAVLEGGVDNVIRHRQSIKRCAI